MIKKKTQLNNHHYSFTELRDVFNKSGKELFFERWGWGRVQIVTEKIIKLTLNCYDLYFKKSSVFG